MRTGGREFGLSVRGPVPYPQEWRGTYRWPFIALCVLLSLGVIASGDPNAKVQTQVIDAHTDAAVSSNSAIERALIDTNAANSLAPVGIGNPAAVGNRATINAVTAPLVLLRPVGNEQVAR